MHIQLRQTNCSQEGIKICLKMYNAASVSYLDYKLSKAEILRGLITEKLTTAAQEIFAVVERTVAGYEEEVSGLKQEIERQRRQLEVVLQPRVTLCRIDEHGLLPVCEEDEADGGLEDAEAAEAKREPVQSDGLDHELLQGQNKQTPPRITDGTVSENKCRTTDNSDEGLTQSKTDSFSSKRIRKRFVRRSFLPSPTNSATASEGEANNEGDDAGRDDWRPRAEGDEVATENKTKLNIKTQPKRQKLLRLSVCLLDDCQINVLSKTVFKKFPVQELLCPFGLQETDFLELLRSAFPRLTADKPFDVFTTYRTRRLQPLEVETLTPEEIYRTIRSTGAGKLALYIRVKTGEERAATGQFDLSHLPDDTTADDPSTSASIMTSDEMRQHMSSTIQHKRENTVAEDAQISKLSDDVQAPCRDVDDDEEEEITDNDDEWKLDTTGKEAWQREVTPQVLSDKRDTVISCKVCGVLYKSKNIVIKHAWTHVDNPGWPCGVCGEHSQSAEELRSHLQSHLKTHICNVCGKCFINMTHFMEHTAGHTGTKLLKCDICNKLFLLKRKLAAHKRSHLSRKHKCYVCYKIFSSQEEFKLHSRVHTEKPYRCSLCGKSLGNLRSLSRHILMHSGEKPYGCEVCGKYFRHLYCLTEHKKTHTVRERPYVCEICCKTFPTQGRLKVHLKTHSKERQHFCSKCGKTFRQKSSVLAHMKVHSDKRPYSCQQCGLSFKHKNNLKNHMNLHSRGKKFVCGTCGKVCLRPENLTVHMRTHNAERLYKCSVCDKAFTRSHCLKTHMTNHQEKKSTLDERKY